MTWQDKLIEAIQHNNQTSGFTDYQVVRLGDGQEPATVLVPLARREHPKLQTFYVHTNSEGTLNVFQVLNWPGSGVTPDNSTPWLEVIIAHVPWSDKLHIVSVADGGLAALGAPPLHLGLQQAATITPDRFVHNGLYIASGMMLGFRGGRFRYNNKNIHINPTASFLDLTSYIPATSGKDRWVLVSVSDIGVAEVVQGPEFDTGDASPASFIPVNLSRRGLYLGRVRLTHGDTALADSQLYPDADVFFVPSPVYQQVSDPGAVGAGVLWFDTSGGAGKWQLKVRNNADTAWELVASGSSSGSAGSGWTSVTIQNNGYADGIFDAYGDNATDRSRLSLRRGRGTIASPEIVQSGDSIGEISFKATDNAGHVEAAVISVMVDGTPGDDDMPGRLQIKTTPDGGNVAEVALSIDQRQVVSVDKVLGFSGTQEVQISGGAVTQTHTRMILESETGTTDDLDTITSAGAGSLIIVSAAAGHTVTLKHGTDNIVLSDATDRDVSDTDNVLLFDDGTQVTDFK